jgi:hypothetical protein
MKIMPAFKLLRPGTVAILLCILLMNANTAIAMDKPLIFPIPQELQVTGESFIKD